LRAAQAASRGAELVASPDPPRPPCAAEGAAGRLARAASQLLPRIDTQLGDLHVSPETLRGAEALAAAAGREGSHDSALTDGGGALGGLAGPQARRAPSAGPELLQEMRLQQAHGVTSAQTGALPAMQKRRVMCCLPCVAWAPPLPLPHRAPGLPAASLAAPPSVVPPLLRGPA